MGRRRKEEVCPVCGKLGFPARKTVRNKVGTPYTYVVFGHHVVRDGGKRSIKWCYVKLDVSQSKDQGVSKKRDNLLTLCEDSSGVSKFTNTCQKSSKGVSKKQDNLLTPTQGVSKLTNTPDMFEKAKQLPGYRSHGYTTLGDMKRLGLIISDWSPEELDEWEEEGLTRVKQHLKERVGTVYYHCVCGEKIDQVDLFLKYRGKCPKCGKQIVKRERIEKVKERKKCRDCEFFVPSKGLDVGVCRKTGKTKHESEFCDSDIPGLIPSKIETSPQEALLNRFLLEARKKLTKGQTYQKHK